MRRLIIISSVMFFALSAVFMFKVSRTESEKRGFSAFIQETDTQRPLSEGAETFVKSSDEYVSKKRKTENPIILNLLGNVGSLICQENTPGSCESNLGLLTFGKGLAGHQFLEKEAIEYISQTNLLISDEGKKLNKVSHPLKPSKKRVVATRTNQRAVIASAQPSPALRKKTRARNKVVSSKTRPRKEVSALPLRDAHAKVTETVVTAPKAVMKADLKKELQSDQVANKASIVYGNIDISASAQLQKRPQRKSLEEKLATLNFKDHTYLIGASRQDKTLRHTNLGPRFALKVNQKW